MQWIWLSFFDLMHSLHMPDHNPNANRQKAAQESSSQTWKNCQKSQFWKHHSRTIQDLILVPLASLEITEHIPIKNLHQSARNWYTAFKISHEKIHDRILTSRHSHGILMIDLHSLWSSKANQYIQLIFSVLYAILPCAISRVYRFVNLGLSKRSKIRTPGHHHCNHHAWTKRFIYSRSIYGALNPIRYFLICPL